VRFTKAIEWNNKKKPNTTNTYSIVTIQHGCKERGDIHKRLRWMLRRGGAEKGGILAFFPDFLSLVSERVCAEWAVLTD
jgi:hypothetical protein